MSEIKKLFVAVDETEHVYTWDYSRKESASQLFDINDECFVLLTTCHEVDEETGAMLDLRVRDFERCYLYSKHTFQVMEVLQVKTGHALSEMKKKDWGRQLQKAQTIQLQREKIYIWDGDLVLER